MSNETRGEVKGLPGVGPANLDGDVLRDIADQMESGEVDFVAIAVAHKGGSIATFWDYVWPDEDKEPDDGPKRLDVHRFLGAVETLAFRFKAWLYEEQR